MQGWTIFIHSLRMVFENLGPALRISGLLYLVHMLVNAYFVLNYADDLQVLQQNMTAGFVPTELPSGLVTAMTLNLVVSLLTSLWIAVLWHRFILLSQIPDSIIPPLFSGMVARYLGKTIQLSLMLAVFGVVLGMLLGVAIGPFLGPLSAAAIPLILLGVLLYLSYRLGLVFPAIALSTPMAFKASWENTKTASGAIAQLAAIAVVSTVIIQIPSNMNSDPSSIIDLIYSYVIGWIAMMVGISVLTTLYGIFIEGREI